MKDHWNKGFNLERFIRRVKPKHVLEAGCLNEENTKNLVSLGTELGYRLTLISDDLDTASNNGYNVTRIRGVSYLEFPKLEEDSVDLAIIDTDHNYWTVQQELINLHTKLTVGAWIVLHDVESFYYDTGLADGYGVDAVPYPTSDIEKLGLERGGLGMGVIDFLSSNRFNYRLVRWFEGSNGVALLQKNQKEFAIWVKKAVEGKGKRETLIKERVLC